MGRHVVKIHPGRIADGVRHRLLPKAEGGGTSLWRWPVAAGIAAIVSALVLSRWGPDQGSRLGRWAWPGDQDAARIMLQVVVASVMTATSVTFSLVVVALQVASQQFSPRLLRGFSRDPVLKAVLAVLVATFTYAITLLRSSGDGDGLPALAMLMTYVSALASLGALLVFINHMSTSLRVDTMMASVHADTRRGVDRFYPERGDPEDRQPPGPPHGALAVSARRSGFVRLIDVPALLAHAREEDLSFWLAVRPGDHVVVGTPLALVASSGEAVDHERVTELVHRGVDMGYERTLEQDPSFGFRKLEDIAVKALSPGVNDPVTAIHAVGHMADLLVRLTDRRLGPQLHGEGAACVVTVDRDFRYYLDLACGQVRRYGAQEPTVLVALLRMLRDVAVSCRDDTQRQEVRRQAALILEVASPDWPAPDTESVHDLAARIEQVLDGEVLRAYLDRSGETRST